MPDKKKHKIDPSPLQKKKSKIMSMSEAAPSLFS